MENQELMKIVEQYHAYWRTHVHPLVDKDPRLYIHFTDTLNQVGRRFYGPKFNLELNCAILEVLFDISAGPMSDIDTRLEQ
ncbi:MAG: hypothetical protein J5I98_01515 [Phaeodactylibacter sp.]|nr:hypothetical protein [Phaeodactylibacter sp.]